MKNSHLGTEPGHAETGTLRSIPISVLVDLILCGALQLKGGLLYRSMMLLSKVSSWSLCCSGLWFAGKDLLGENVSMTQLNSSSISGSVSAKSAEAPGRLFELAGSFHW